MRVSTNSPAASGRLRKWSARLTLAVLATSPIWVLSLFTLRHHQRVWWFGLQLGPTKNLALITWSVILLCLSCVVLVVVSVFLFLSAVSTIAWLVDESRGQHSSWVSGQREFWRDF